MSYTIQIPTHVEFYLTYIGTASNRGREKKKKKKILNVFLLSQLVFLY